MRDVVPNHRMLFRMIRPNFKISASVLFLVLYECYSRAQNRFVLTHAQFDVKMQFVAGRSF